MYADRYAPRRVNRGSLGLSVGIVAPLLAAAMLASPTVRHALKDPPLVLYPVDPTPPPKPEPLPKPQPQSKARPTPHVERTTKLVPTEPNTSHVAQLEPPQPSDPGLGASDAGTGPALVEPVKPPPPVLTGIEPDPRYAHAFQPLYPPAELRAGRDGVVTLKVLVGVDGRVRQAEQVSATSDEFWRVTQKQALAKWRFKPATRDGVPYEAWRTMTVRFRVEDAEG